MVYHCANGASGYLAVRILFALVPQPCAAALCGTSCRAAFRSMKYGLPRLMIAYPPHSRIIGAVAGGRHYVLLQAAPTGDQLRGWLPSEHYSSLPSLLRPAKVVDSPPDNVVGAHIMVAFGGLRFTRFIRLEATREAKSSIVRTSFANAHATTFAASVRTSSPHGDDGVRIQRSCIIDYLNNFGPVGMWLHAFPYAH